jgi:hypothetical protein
MTHTKINLLHNKFAPTYHIVHEVNEEDYPIFSRQSGIRYDPIEHKNVDKTLSVNETKRAIPELTSVNGHVF